MYDPTPEYLVELDPNAASLAHRLVYDARIAGVPLIVISGRRNAGRNREIGGAEHSLHLDGLAFDVAVVGYSRDRIPFWWWQALGEYAEGLGLYWGGRFLHGGRPDVNHFDLRRLLQA